MNSGGTGINNSFTLSKLFKCLSTLVESHPEIVKPIGNEIVSCIVSAPTGSDAGVTCASKLLCVVFPAVVLKILASSEKLIISVSEYQHFEKKKKNLISCHYSLDTARDFDQTRKNSFDEIRWEQYLIGSPFYTCVSSVCKMW